MTITTSLESLNYAHEDSKCQRIIFCFKKYSKEKLDLNYELIILTCYFILNERSTSVVIGLKEDIWKLSALVIPSVFEFRKLSMAQRFWFLYFSSSSSSRLSPQFLAFSVTYRYFFLQGYPLFGSSSKTDRVLLTSQIT